MCKMRTLTRSFVTLIGCTLLLWGPARAGAVEARLADDTYTVSNKATNNFGNEKDLDVQGPPANSTVQRTYIRFDLSSLPPGTLATQVSKATLRLFVSKVNGNSNTFAVDVRTVLPPTSGPAWTESTLTAGNAATSAPLGSLVASGVSVTQAKLADFIDV